MALDLHGNRGSVLRRRLVFTEFVAAAAIGIAAGTVALTASAPATSVFRFYLLGIGVNYAALVVVAWKLLRRGALRDELEGGDIPPELRRYGTAQARLLVPFWVALQAFWQSRLTRLR